MAGVVIDTKCPKCGGTITSDHGEPLCINCGYNPVTRKDKTPDEKTPGADKIEPQPKNAWERVKWNNKYRKAILADEAQLGLKATAAKYGISKRGLINMKSYPRSESPQSIPPSPPAGTVSFLPSLPAWNESWRPGIKEAWLNCYMVLITRR